MPSECPQYSLVLPDWTLLELSGPSFSPSQLILFFTLNRQSAPGMCCSSPAPLCCRNTGADTLQYVLRRLFIKDKTTDAGDFLKHLPPSPALAGWRGAGSDRDAKAQHGTCAWFYSDHAVPLQSCGCVGYPVRVERGKEFPALRDGLYSV